MPESKSPSTDGAAQDNGVSGSEMAPTPDLSVNGNDSDADLFGDDDTTTDLPNTQQPKLDDEDLDSGDDEDRNDRLAETIEEDEDEEEAAEQKQQYRISLAEIARITPPEADELYLLNMPNFLGIAQRAYDPTTFEPPTRPHGADQNDPVPVNFSAFYTAMTSLRWRHDPQNSSKLQSNARLIRWSDGSLSLQLASAPKDQYRISAQALRQSFGKSKAQKTGTHQTDYDPAKDAQVYLGAYHEEGDLTEIIAPADAALKILATGDLADESVLKLQQSLAANMNVHDPLTTLKHVKEDPELAKLRAEQYEKERMRASRRREAAEERLLGRKDRVLGRAGLGRGGLSVAGLEDEDGMLGSSGFGGARKQAKRRKTNRRGIIYSDDEDEGMPRGRTREDEYDEDDGFLVGSDEEPEVFDSGNGEEEEAAEEDPDVDDLEIAGRQTVLESSTRGGERDRNREFLTADRGGRGSQSRSRATTPPREVEGGATQGSPNAGRKKRRVIDDDDDE